MVISFFFFFFFFFSLVYLVEYYYVFRHYISFCKNSSRKIFRMLLSVLLYLDINAPRSTCLGVMIAKTESSTFEKCFVKISFSESENSDIMIGLLFNYK